MANEQTSPIPAAAASSRERLLRAAKQLFAAKGYENTSTVTIARMAGTSESQLMKHFGSKEGLLEAVFDSAWGQISDAVRQVVTTDQPPGQKLNALSELMLKALEADEELRTLMLLEGRRIRKEGHMVMLTHGFLDFIKSLDAVLHEMRANGQLVEDVSVEAVRSALMGAMEGLLRDQVLAKQVGYPASFGPADVRKIFNALARALMRRTPAAETQQ